ncbi:MAG: hypothetical protein Fur0024_2910 [Patescibacteria group bacterium]
MQNLQNNFKKFLTALPVLISRFGFLPPNFSPVGSFGFFSGNFLLFALVTIGFDYIYGGFYKGVIFTYIGFLAYFILGKLAKNSVKLQFTLLPIASFLFFLISNFGVWYFWYPVQTFDTLTLCYTLALPFYKNTFLSDLVFGWGYLGVREVLKKFLVTIQFQKIKK